MLVERLEASQLTPAPLDDMVETLHRLSGLQTPVPGEKALAAYHADFRGRPRFLKGYKRLHAALLRRRSDGTDPSGRLQGLLETVCALPRVFSHGDPDARNILAGGMVLDWDLCGHLPLGWDQAWVARDALEENSLRGALTFFDVFLRRDKVTEAAHSFGFLFFLMLFHALRYGRAASPEFIGDIFLHLEERQQILPCIGAAPTR